MCASDSYLPMITESPFKMLILLSLVFTFVAFNHVETSSSIKLPTLGVGILDIKSEVEKENALVLALNAGYRMVDVWEWDEVPLKNAIQRMKVAREEIFIIVKLYPPETVNELHNTGDAVDGILERLQTTYIDLLVLNYPDLNNQHIQRWKSMISLKNRGKVKHLGVGNFNYNQVLSLANATAVIPSVIQLEINPFFQQKELVLNLTAKGIAIQAYSPLANAQKLEDSRLVKIAQIYEATTAQLMIQWCVQKGYSCITKSTKKEHLDDNINLGEFFIEENDMKELDSLEERFVTNYDPNDARFSESSDFQGRKTEFKPKKGRRGDDLDEEENKDDPQNYDSDIEVEETEDTIEPQHEFAKGENFNEDEMESSDFQGREAEFKPKKGRRGDDLDEEENKDDPQNYDSDIEVEETEDAIEPQHEFAKGENFNEDEMDADKNNNGVQDKTERIRDEF